MSPRPSTATADARTTVQLNELIALRQRVARSPLRHARVASPSAGSHAGRRRGRGMDYLESRAYQAGDDVRHLDWRLTARSGSLHTKIFQEEHEHRVMLLVDCHASMRFGTRERFKSVQAARAAALAAWQVARAGGRVGALAFGPCRRIQQAGPGSRGALAVCGALTRWDAMAHDDAPEPLSAALQRMRPLLRGTSHALVISDGHCGDARMQAMLTACQRYMRVSVLLVTDPLETELAAAGRYPLSCDGQRIMVDLTAQRGREDFRHAMGAGADKLEAAARALALPCRRIDTRTDSFDAVTGLLGLARRGTR